MKRKLLIALPLLTGALFLSQVAFTKLDNFTSVNRAGDPVGPGVTTKRDCAACHSGVTPIVNNTQNRIFTLDTGITSYIPGTKYKVKFKIKATTTVGFSATVLKNDSNIMAGMLEAKDTNETKVFLHAASGRSYMNHRVGAVTGDEKEYEFYWTAPAKGAGSVTFYISSLSSNKDDGTSDDTTYNNSYVITEGSSVGLVKNTSNISVSVYPNPATDRLQVELNKANAGSTQIALYSIDGKEAITLMNENITSGAHTFTFDLAGKVQSGIYFVRISNGGTESIQKILFN